jgi:hypothetical protein
MRVLHWLFSLARMFDAALEWQEADDLLLDDPTPTPPTAWAQAIG